MTQLDQDLEENSRPSPLDKASAKAAGPNESTPLIEKADGQCVHYWSLGLHEFLQNLSDHFGYRLLLLLFSVQHLMKGFALSFFSQAKPYIYRSYYVPAPQVQIFNGIASLPWALKPILGLLSDVLPIGGYNKAPYMLLVSVLGTAGFLYVGLMPHDQTSITMVVVCFVLFSLQCSVCDLLSEAKYAERMQAAPKHGPALLTYVWFGLQIGGFVAVSTAGTVIHSWGPKANFLIAAVPAASIIVPVALGYVEEKCVSRAELAEVRNRYYQQWEACGLCLLMLVGSALMLFCGLCKHDPQLNCVVALSIGAVILIAFSLVLSPVIAKFNAFSLIQTALGVSTSGASFYFYTDTPEMYPEGPHFSEFFYNTVMGVAGSVCALLGILFYQRYMSTWRYRSMLVFTNLVLSGFAALDILMFARVNVKLGIPDHILVLGLSIFESIIAQWQWMPQVVILSYLCPKGMEATMYALLAGCHNMGNTIASNAGALLLRELGVQPRGEPGESRQFELLWVAATVSTILPLVAILVLYKLIPDARQNERIVDAAHDATSGSIWRRWFPRED
eukprot:CAMPEP_0179017378 /NCGR_PEP_ID=MMETSP0796-20121207/3807_1 /TAXON_ID=73915 /ORGANISM="Pyrodinium bahamense, Strain pbaha01" /LENGTH=560 /DNA_ID=CAMNT_0020713103 /DNA_START=58 /DNA_END=1740 /DNA_ORIENTATION=+